MNCQQPPLQLSRHLLRGLPTQRDDYYLERDNENLPKIGSRVRRGPDWQWREQDSYGPGTVIGHAIGKFNRLGEKLPSCTQTDH